jgi:hypothetical protein
MENDGDIIFHSEAFAELEHAHRWYEEQAPGIGGLFFQEVQYAVARIRNPGSMACLFARNKEIPSSSISLCGGL